MGFLFVKIIQGFTFLVAMLVIGIALYKLGKIIYKGLAKEKL